LSIKAPVAYIDVRTLAHATEDQDKVEEAVLNTLPTQQAHAFILRKSSLTGHHGNPIVLLETRIKDKEVVKEALQKLASGLSIMDKELLGSEIERHLEKGNLYIRLDKQSAYMNQIKLCKVDPVHVKVHFKKSDTEQVIRICRDSGLIP
jgi:RNA binding exosome subunit